MKTDVLIIGSGCSGLYCALQLPADKKITIITKSDLESSDSFLAQGGMCMLKEDADYDSYFEDTLKAGHYENDKKSVDIMIRSSKDVVKDLLNYGVDFQRDENGELAYTREGAHSTKRILFHEDITGKEMPKYHTNRTYNYGRYCMQRKCMLWCSDPKGRWDIRYGRSRFYGIRNRRSRWTISPFHKLQTLNRGCTCYFHASSY